MRKSVIMGSITSGEGLLNIFEGTGTVLVAPVPNLYQNIVNRCGGPVRPPGPSHRTIIIGKLIGCAGKSFGLLILAVVGLIVAFRMGWL